MGVEEIEKQKGEEAERRKEEGNVLFSKGQYEDAVKLYTLALSLSPKTAVYYSNRAACNLAMGKAKEALLDAKVAVEILPDFTRAWGRLARAALVLGDEGEVKRAVPRLGVEEGRKLEAELGEVSHARVSTEVALVAARWQDSLYWASKWLLVSS